MATALWVWKAALLAMALAWARGLRVDLRGGSVVGGVVLAASLPSPPQLRAAAPLVESRALAVEMPVSQSALSDIEIFDLEPTSRPTAAPPLKKTIRRPPQSVRLGIMFALIILVLAMISCCYWQCCRPLPPSPLYPEGEDEQEHQVAPHDNNVHLFQADKEP